MSATMIAGGALLVASIALIMSVASNVRGYSLHQRMLDLERRLRKDEAGPSGSRGSDGQTAGEAGDSA